MPAPAQRNPIQLARGPLAALQQHVNALSDGEPCWADDTNELYITEGADGSRRLVPVVGPGSGSAEVSPTPPTGPSGGDLWLNTGDDSLWVFNPDPAPGQWEPVSPPCPPPATLGPVPPTDPSGGDFWFNTGDGSLWVFNPDPAPGQWVLTDSTTTDDGVYL
jgi:hypothetical protein